jgi:lipoprotein-anchoring transpeptidase ErfK/SrfK
MANTTKHYFRGQSVICQIDSTRALLKAGIFFTSVFCTAAAVGVAAPVLAANPPIAVMHAATPSWPTPIATPVPETAADEAAPERDPSLDFLAKAETDAATIFGQRLLKPGQFVWSKNAHRAVGPSRVVVSIADQRAYVYRGDTLIALTTTSTGKRGHPTPTGSFKVTEKRKVHFSSKYNNAPMPYMQRLTDYGIALHAGPIPGYPASHGCIRLPHKFAADLFKLTDVGATVIIAA